MILTPEYRPMYKYPLHWVEPIANLRDMTRYACRTFADRPAFQIKPRRGEPYVPVSYADFGQHVDAFGAGLYDLGVRHNSRVAILAETRYEWYVSYLSVVNGEGIVVPLDKELPVEELTSMLDRSETSVLIYSASLRDKALAIAKQTASVRQLILMDYYKDEKKADPDREKAWTEVLTRGAQKLKAGDRSFIDCPIDVDEMRILLFTSGTTARSKAVMHSHRTICTNLMAMSSMLYVGNDNTLSILPLHHTYECTCGFLCQLYRGNTVFECEGLRHITDNLKEGKITLILGVPLILEAFHKKIWQGIRKKGKEKTVRFALKLTALLRKMGIDLRRKVFADIHAGLGGHLRLLIAGGAAIDPQVLKDFNDFGILAVQGYGLTECGPILALNRDRLYKNTSAGLPLPGTEAEVFQPDENGIGEFRSRGPNVMLGYYGDPELTAKTLRDGWFYTGDYGYITADNFLIITGRKKNMIVTKNGKNIFPEEIEAVLNRHPEIAESVVSGQEDKRGDLQIVVEIYPDEAELKAALHTDSYTATEAQAHMANLVKAFNANQPIYKKIRQVVLRDEPFAKNTSKKILRENHN